MSGRRGRVLAILAGLLFLGALGAGGALHHALYSGEADPDASCVRVDIPPGATLPQISRRLEEAGLVRAWQLRLVARLEGGARALKAGSYDLPRGSSPAELLRRLVRGEVRTVEVTLPEGWTLDRAVEALAGALSVPLDSLRHYVTEPLPRWRSALQLPEERDLEGYLFPETYRFTPGVGAVDVVETLLHAFEAAVPDSFLARASSLGMGLDQVVTLASIVEAEARRADERARVAAVYHNRLRRGWRLEADPTVAYAVGKIGQPLSYRDLEVDSAYNTYRREGLPPGPINSPGRAALQAALWPDSTTTALYFVADGDGGHVFSDSWEEHRRAVQQYRRIRRERAQRTP